jgi:hypothetical protein
MQLAISGISTLEDCLDKYFAETPTNTENRESRRYYYMLSFPNFLFLRLTREIWRQGDVEKDCHPVAFPRNLNMTKYAGDQTSNYDYELAGVMVHLGNPRQRWVHYITFISIYGQLFEYNDSSVRAVDEADAVEGNFPRSNPWQTATMLLYVAVN